MQNSATKKAIDTACGFLARRGHSRVELSRKLLKKGFSSEETEQALAALADRGYINDADNSLRWAQSLAEGRGWGRAKIAAYPKQKGISRENIDNAQKRLWDEVSEEALARKALHKRFPPGTQQQPAKMASFLKGRGFSSDIIYTLLRDLPPEQHG